MQKNMQEVAKLEKELRDYFLKTFQLLSDHSERVKVISECQKLEEPDPKYGQDYGLHLHIWVDKNDYPKVIGKNSYIVKAIWAILSGIRAKNRIPVKFDVLELEE